MTENKTPEYNTRVEHVTFFEDRARVHRVASLTLAPGAHEILLADITSLVDDPSVVVAVEPPIEGARVLTSKVKRIIREREAGSEAEIHALLDRSAEATAALADSQREVARLDKARARLVAVEQSLRSQLFRAPGAETCEPGAWIDSLARIEAEFTQLHDAHAEALTRVEDAKREIRRADELLAAARRIEREMESYVEVQLENATSEQLELSLDLRYFTPCALWRPAHRARLLRDTSEDGEETTHIEFDTFATVWQRTGERWDDVACSFSTARPTQAAKPPLLADDVLRTRPKTEEERRTIQVEAREVDISSNSATSKKVNDMPGVDDGGEPLKLRASKPVSAPSTGRPVHVPISTTTLPCVTQVVAYPERSQVAYLRATTTWGGEHPLLAGPVTLIRGEELTGTAPIKFASPGEEIEIGFGVESGVRIKRSVKNKDIPRKLSRWTRTERTVTLHVSNMSGEHRQVTIIERIPVSELEQVTIETIELPTSTSPDQDGFLEIERDLGPRHTDEYKIVLHIDKAHNVNLRL